MIDSILPMMLLSDFWASLAEWDADLLLAINGCHAPWADHFMYAFSGKLVWVPMYASLLYLIFRNLHWRWALGCVVAIALTITFADQMGASVIRPWVARLRPANVDNPLSEFVHIVNGYRGGRYGFPSCHAANTFGLACFIAFVFRHRLLVWFMMAWAVLTCYSRAYLGVHYPGDLLAGALLGLLGAALCYGLFVKVCAYRRPETLKEAWVPVGVGGLTILGILLYALCSAPILG